MYQCVKRHISRNVFVQACNVVGFPCMCIAYNSHEYIQITENFFKVNKTNSTQTITNVFQVPMHIKYENLDMGMV